MRRRIDPTGWPDPRSGHLESTGRSLPSDIPGYRFNAEVQGRWEETPSARPHNNPAEAALHYTLATARAITCRYALNDVHAAQAHLNSVLGTVCDLKDLPVRVLWANIRLTTTDQDRAAVSALQQRLHSEALHEQIQRQRLQAARDLHEQLVTTPTLALAYWLTQRPDATKDTLESLEELTRQITAHAADNAWVQVSHLLQTFVSDLAADQRANLVRSLAQIVLRYDQPQLAEQLQNIAIDLASASGLGKGPA
ncbi:hypothetical protein GTW43_24875 [Streptomyces sp. SID5785]|uniref:hypothetical protein n=1 Tax=Streptomyces sp. SID5785 TaxID=2690309 RepID=UPI001361118C|nr:hypothetical protein [Streptomyces sp. SID5785]MZD08289.1 hypothetical protein [Streptomyces sp. SID5785]